MVVLYTEKTQRQAGKKQQKANILLRHKTINGNQGNIGRESSKKKEVKLDTGET